MKVFKWILTQHFHGEPKNEDLQLVEEELPELNENGFTLLKKKCFIFSINFLLQK
jgi:hypothetical protein